jgi:hypothetical protein
VPASDQEESTLQTHYQHFQTDDTVYQPQINTYDLGNSFWESKKPVYQEEYSCQNGFTNTWEVGEGLFGISSQIQVSNSHSIRADNTIDQSSSNRGDEYTLKQKNDLRSHSPDASFNNNWQINSFSIAPPLGDLMSSVEDSDSGRTLSTPTFSEVNSNDVLTTNLFNGKTDFQTMSPENFQSASSSIQRRWSATFFQQHAFAFQCAKSRDYTA